MKILADSTQLILLYSGRGVCSCSFNVEMLMLHSRKGEKRCMDNEHILHEVFLQVCIVCILGMF